MRDPAAAATAFLLMPASDARERVDESASRGVTAADERDAANRLA